MWSTITRRSSEKGACFFDIDGVLNNSSDWSRQYTFRPELVANLCRFAKEKNLDLIMVSSWRIGFSAPMSSDNLPHVQKLEKEMQKHGILLKGKTPVFKGKSRDMEIERYLAYHPYSRCIVIDDDKEEYSSSAFDSSIITIFLTNSAKGFDKDALKRAYKLI